MVWPWKRKPPIPFYVEVVDYALDYRLNALLVRLTAEEAILKLSPPPTGIKDHD